MTDESRRVRDVRIVPPKPEREVDDELKFHLEQRIQKYIDAGMTPEAARAAALERFGNVDNVRETCAQILAEDRSAESRRDWFDDLKTDLKFAARSAVRTPLFSALAVLTLALGIGANTAVFGVAKSVLLNALPYRDADHLARLYAPLIRDGAAPKGSGSFSAGTISDVRERQHSFTTLGAFQRPRDVVYTAETPQVVQGMFVEPELFRTLGVSPALGPGFRDEDAEHDTTTTTILSHGAWQRMRSPRRLAALAAPARCARVVGYWWSRRGFAPRCGARLWARVTALLNCERWNCVP